MATVNHIGFIVASYAAAIVVIAGLTAWVMLDYRAQRRNLAELDKRGIARRSAAEPAGRAMEEAKEKA
jgi:heme exporter protein D